MRDAGYRLIVELLLHVIGDRIFQVQSPDNMVDILFDHGEPGIRHAYHVCKCVIQRHVPVDRGDIPSVGHDILRLFVIELEDVCDHLRFIFVDGSLLMSFIDQ